MCGRVAKHHFATRCRGQRSSGSTSLPCERLRPAFPWAAGAPLVEGAGVGPLEAASEGRKSAAW